MTAVTSEMLGMTDSEYQRWLQRRLHETGALGDVFPLMVSRNVPQFLLRKLWPDLWTQFEARPHVMMFGAAEEGWRGKLDNLKARATKAAVDSGSSKMYRVKFRKTYVMECESLLVLTRPAEAPDDVALVWIPRPGAIVNAEEASDPAENRQTWTQRTEPGLSMDRRDGPPAHHYIVEGDLLIPAARVLRISRRMYATVATQLPRREISSMALLAIATLRRETLSLSPEIQERETRLLAARDGARLSGIHMKIAQEILTEFFSLTQEKGVQLHPLWDRIRDMAGQVR